MSVQESNVSQIKTSQIDSTKPTENSEFDSDLSNKTVLYLKALDEQVTRFLKKTAGCSVWSLPDVVNQFAKENASLRNHYFDVIASL